VTPYVSTASRRGADNPRVLALLGPLASVRGDGHVGLVVASSEGYLHALAWPALSALPVSRRDRVPATQGAGARGAPQGRSSRWSTIGRDVHTTEALHELGA
jgi:hypothetical protein